MPLLVLLLHQQVSHYLLLLEFPNGSVRSMEPLKPMSRAGVFCLHNVLHRVGLLLLLLRVGVLLLHQASPAHRHHH
jgi:hypothetical protein